eukprot:4173364-Amphidinium_carterae.1
MSASAMSASAKTAASSKVRAKILVEVDELQKTIAQVGLPCYLTIDKEDGQQTQEQKMLPFFLTVLESTKRISRVLLESALAKVKAFSRTVKLAFMELTLACWKRLVKAAANSTSGKKSTPTQNSFKEKWMVAKGA